MKHIDELSQQIENERPRLELLRKHWRNESPVSFMSKDARESLDNKLSSLSVNFPALVVESRVDRMKIRGFREVGTDDLSGQVGDWWEQLNMAALAELVHTDNQMYGAAFVTVWSDAGGRRPAVTLDSAFNAAVKLDRATGERLAGLRTWSDGKNKHRVYYTPESITRQISTTADGGQWSNHGPVVRNPLGVVPIVPFIRRTSINDTCGTSAVSVILDLCGALAKVLQDAMVTSEYFAKPRRWATGLEIREDDDGNPIDPFGKKRFLQSEDPDTKFGQLSATGPDAYAEMVATLTQQIGSLTGLPPHYLGLHGDQPANAEGVKAAETQLIMRVQSEMQSLTRPWAEVATLIMAVANGVRYADAPAFITEWRSPEIKTMAQASDSATKLHQLGVPLRELLSDPLDFPAHKIKAIMGEVERELLKRAAVEKLG